MTLIYVIGYDNIDIFEPNNFKVGKSTEKSLKSRLSQIQTGSPKPCKVHATFPVKDAYLEKVCHAHLHNYRNVEIKHQHGEWFFGKFYKIKKIIQEVLKDYQVKEENKIDKNYVKLEKEYNEKKIKAKKDVEEYLHKCDTLKKTVDELLFQHNEITEQEKNLKELVNQLRIYDKNKYCYGDAYLKKTNKNTTIVEWISLILKMCNRHEVDIVNYRLKNFDNEVKNLDTYNRIDISCLSKYYDNEVFKYYPKTKKVTWDTPPSKWGYGQSDQIVGNATKVFTDYNHDTQSFNYTLQIDEEF